MDKKIIILGARRHNLGNTAPDLPQNNFIVITGFSDSDKSVLVFDMICAEGQGIR